MDEAQDRPSASPSVTAQFVMPWFMGAAWIPTFDGEKATFVEWRAQVEAMLRAQGLSQQQQADFVFGALEGEAKRELQLVIPRDKNTGQKVLDILQTLYAKQPTRAQLRSHFFKL
ncbi:GTP cyclohydrolase 1 [Dissostichus eleginoides]|uniref:GTP cyclohydrolase 1 n=1 Tax=Dissostichus eleginoides TaxID=100907 RepID=A0AAD9C7V1_DISEL|nr:GTP cyclohydrolase 1 [Dissostichus eleginoides]